MLDVRYQIFGYCPISYVPCLTSPVIYLRNVTIGNHTRTYGKLTLYWDVWPHCLYATGG